MSKKDLDLIKEVIDDWGKGEMSDGATLWVIHSILNKEEPSADAIQWAMEDIRKSNDSRLSN
jgi:hypothetical protein